MPRLALHNRTCIQQSFFAASAEVHLRPSFAYMPETHLLTSKVSRFEDLRQSSPPTLIIIHNFFLILVFDKKGNNLYRYYVCEFIHTFIGNKLVVKDIEVHQ
jgi:hypothetical protein